MPKQSRLRLSGPVLALSLLGASCASLLPDIPLGDPARDIVRGPIPTRILQPAGLIFPIPRPRRAHVLKAGAGEVRPDITYASIFEARGLGFDAARFDGEIARVSARLAFGLGGGAEITVEPQLLYGTSGALDHLVNEFHRITGLPGGGREQAEDDQYEMELRRNGVTAYELEEDQILFGDLPISWVQALRVEDANGPAVATRLTVELPTGDEGRGSGSGDIDGAAGVILERSLGRWTFTGGVDGVKASQPTGFRRAGISVRTLVLVNGSVEYRWSRKTSLLFTALLQTPLTRDLPFEEINREILDLGFGISRDLTDASRLTLSFHEDAVAASGPDLTLYAGLTFSW